MDELDHRLIYELQPDPRKSISRLAKSLGITEATVSRRIERLLSSGELFITALPDLKTFGYITSAYILLRTSPSSRSSEIAQYLCQSPSLWYISTCEGWADIFLRGDFTSNENLADFITDYLGKIPGISGIETLVELKPIKKRTFGIEKRTFGIEKRDVTGTVEKKLNDVIFDEIDHHIILELQKDSRTPLKKLADDVGLSKPTVYKRIKNLVLSGAIDLTAIPNTVEVNFPVACLLGVEAELPQIKEVAKSISQYTQVVTVGLYSGPKQILASIYPVSPEDLLRLVNQEIVKIEGVIRTDLLLQLKAFKQRYSWFQ